MVFILPIFSKGTELGLLFPQMEKLGGNFWLFLAIKPIFN